MRVSSATTTPATKLAKLEALLAHTAPPAEDVALIADLLSLPVSPEARLAELTPQRRKERSFAAILRQYEGLARTQPLVGVFEDLHWADPTTLELLDQLVRRSSICRCCWWRPRVRTCSHPGRASRTSRW